jgi:hypothetical protein
VEIMKSDAYDLIGRVVEILPKPAPLNAKAPAVAAVDAGVYRAGPVARIATGAPLRVLG